MLQVFLKLTNDKVLLNLSIFIKYYFLLFLLLLVLHIILNLMAHLPSNSSIKYTHLIISLNHHILHQQFFNHLVQCFAQILHKSMNLKFLNLALNLKYQFYLLSLNLNQLIFKKRILKIFQNIYLLDLLFEI